MPERRETKVTKEQLHKNEKLYIESEDPMVVHQTAVEAEASGTPMPPWVIREWTKWSRKLSDDCAGLRGRLSPIYRRG